MSTPVRLIPPAELAKILGLSEKTIRRRVKDGTIPAIQIGGKHKSIRFDLDSVLLALKPNRKQEDFENVGAGKSAKSMSPRFGPKPKWMRKVHQ